MSESAEEPAGLRRGQVEVTSRFDITYLRDGEHSLVIPVPDDVAMLIGGIVVLWGGFELRMDALMEHILPGVSYRPRKGWKGHSFGQRRDMFRDIMAEYTARHFPAESETFRRLAEDSKELQWLRNTVAHGYVKGHSVPNPAKPGAIMVKFYAISQYKDEKSEVDLDVPTLEKLRHDIAHLGGNLMAAINRMGGHIITDSPEIVVADRDFLRGPQSGNFQPLAISKAPASPPRSSQE